MTNYKWKISVNSQRLSCYSCLLSGPGTIVVAARSNWYLGLTNHHILCVTKLLANLDVEGNGLHEGTRQHSGTTP